MTTPAADRPRRAYGLALAALTGAAVVAVVSFGLVWQRVETALLPGSPDAVAAVDVTGRDLYPWAAVGGWVALASVAGVIATRSWGRVVVGAVALLAGAASVAAAASFGVAAAVGSTLAWLPALLAGLGVAVAGGWIVARGRGWPSLGSRYDRAGPTARDVSPWAAQDLGRDPTDDLVE